MTITAIEPKKKGLSAIYIDGEYAVSVDTETVLSMKIDVCTEITDEKLHELIETSNVKRAKDKALWLISFRDHSKRELIEKVSKDYGDDAAQKAADRLEELGLINDENFAHRYAHDLLYIKHLSPTGAVRKLIEKGIDRDLAKDAVDEFDLNVQENIISIIDKKYAKILIDEKGRRRCVNGLMRLGYNYSDIKSALNQYIEFEQGE